MFFDVLSVIKFSHVTLSLIFSTTNPANNSKIARPARPFFFLQTFGATTSSPTNPEIMERILFILIEFLQARDLYAISQTSHQGSNQVQTLLASLKRVYTLDPHMTVSDYNKARRHGVRTPSVAWATQTGNLEILQVVYPVSTHMRDFICLVDDVDFCDMAVVHGHLACLRYLRENPKPWPWDDTTTGSAAQHNQVACLKYAVENGCPVYITCIDTAAANGSMECLEYLHEQGIPWNKWTGSKAAQSGKLETLKFIHEHDGEITTTQAISAASSGHVHILKYLVEKKCPMSNEVLMYAAENGHTECVELLHPPTMQHANDQMARFKVPRQHTLLESVAELGHVKCLEAVHQSGHAWTPIVTEHVLKVGDPECIAYMNQRVYVKKYLN